MSKRRLSFTERRRTRLARKVEILDALEPRSTITEPISLTALSLGGWMAWIQNMATLATGDGAASIGSEMAHRLRRDGRITASERGSTSIAIADVSIPEAPAARGGGWSGWTAAIDLGTRPASSQNLGLNRSAYPALATDDVPVLPVNAWRPARANSGGQATPSRGGGGGSQPLASALAGGVSSPAISSSSVSTASNMPAAANPGMSLSAAPTSPGAPIAQVPMVTAGAGLMDAAAEPEVPVDPTSLAGIDLTNAPWPIIGNAADASPDSAGEGFALLSFSNFPIYTLDYNNGVVLFPNAYQFANPGGNVDLRAQVRDTTGPYTYTWDTTGLSGVATSIASSGYKLTFRWNSTITGGPYIRTVGLTVTDGSSHNESQTYTFYVPNGTGTAGTGTRTWAGSLPPDLVRADAPAWTSHNLTVASNSGAVSTQMVLPAYSPNVPSLVFSYDSLAADPRPIVVIHHEMNPSLAVPNKTSAQLRFNATTGSTYYYDTSQFIAGDIAQIALQADATALSTDRYAYTATIIDDRGGTPTTTTYTGNAIVINEASSAFGAGWTLQGLTSLKTNPTGGGGVILNLGSGDALWFSGSPGAGGGSYTSPAGEFTTLAKNADGTYTRTLIDGTTVNFNSSGQQTSVVDRNGLRTTFTYSSGNLSTITDPYSKLTTFTYSSGKLSSVKDPAGRLTTFTIASGTTNEIRQADGNRVTYTYSSNRLTQLKDPRAKVVTVAYDSANRASTITRPDGTTETFTAYQKRGFDTTGTSMSPAPATLLAEARATYGDPLGNATDRRADWGGLGLTNQLTDPLGNVATMDRDANGLATIAIDRLNRITRYGYDAKSNVTTITYHDGNVEKFTYNSFSKPLTHTDVQNRTTSYAYDGTGNNTVIEDALNKRTTMTYTANGRLATVKDANTNVTSHQYDSQDRLTTITYPDGTTTKYAYESKGNVATVVDERNNATTYAYDSQNRQTGMKDALGGRTTYVYDAAGNRTQVQAPTPAGQTARTTGYAYDSMNRVTTVTDPLGHTTVTAYDLNGNAKTVTDALGRVTTQAYDALNRPTVKTDPLNHLTTTIYDAEAQVLNVADPNSAVTTYAYSVRGFLSTGVDPNGKTVTYVYSATGKLTQKQYQIPAGKGTVAYTLTYTYDANDRLIASTDPSQGRPTYTYDAVGNRTAATDGNNHTTSFAYDSRNRMTTITDALGHTTVYGYDATGNRATVKDGLGHVTTTLYDALNRATTVIDSLSGTTTTAYDVAGRQTGLTDPVGNRTTWAYDSADRLTTVTDPQGNPTTYAYNNADELTGKTDRNGRRVTYAYDAVGRRTGETWVSGSRSITYTYDNVGRLTGATDPSGTLTYTYDMAGNQLTEVTSGGGSGQPNVTLTSGYNGTDDRTTLADNLTSPRTTTFMYDLTERLTTIAAGGLSVGYAYDAANNLQSISRSNGLAMVMTTFAYDAADRLVTLTHSFNNPYATKGNPTTGMLATYVYGYDNANRGTSQQDAEGTTTFTYDNTDQLTAAGGARTEAYGYDANGNRNTTGYATGTNNRMTASSGVTYTYDNEGNLISKTVANGAGTADDEISGYTWDYRNRLTAVTKTVNGSVTMAATYTYDAKDRRIGAKVDDDGSGPHAAAQTWTVYDGENTYADFDGSGNLTNRYLYGPAIDAILARTSSGGTTAWYLPDRLGSIRDVVSESASVLDHIVYDSYGRVTSETNAANGDRFKFTGREYDPTTGLYYYRARSYDPAVGRFVSQDPSGFTAGDTNFYRYVGNSPTSRIDPSGLDWLDDYASGFWSLASKVQFTVGAGYTGEFYLGPIHIQGSIGFQYGLDLKHGTITAGSTIGVQGTIGSALGLGGSIGPYATVTSAGDVKNLAGPGNAVGVSTPIGGVDIGWPIGIDDHNVVGVPEKPYGSITVSSPGIIAGGHIEPTYTWLFDYHKWQLW